MAVKVGVRRRIGEILVQKGVITEEQLEKAIQIQESEPEKVRRRLGVIISEDIGVDHHKVMKEIANLYAFREVGKESEEAMNQRAARIKEMTENFSGEVLDDLMHRKAIPYKVEGGTLILATSDPTDPSLSTIAGKLPFKQYELAYCRKDTVEKLINKVYEQKNEFLDLLEEFEYQETDEEGATEEQVDEKEIDAEINQSMLNSLVEGMLVEGVRKGVSDVHILPGPAKNTTEIRFRLDGKLQLWYTQTGIKPEAVLAVIKDKTRNVDRFERDASQDGFMQRRIDGTNIRFRVSIMPIVAEEFERKYESVVIRILDDRKVITDLNKLGLQDQSYRDFYRAITQPSGIVIITGPTGSGKSTTLVAALYSVIDPTVNVLTVEEPVEYLIRGARQLKISENMSFDQAIRGILRHDPDIVLVGEIRDLITAEIAIKLANTGHLTFSTLHTNDAPSAVSRLFKMGVEPFLIGNAINLVMAQRLLRKICDNCKKEDKEMTWEKAKAAGFTEEEYEQTTFYQAVGCNKCNQGYKGRIAIHEALYFDKDVKRLIFESGDDIDEERIRQYAVSNGMLTLRGSGRERIKSGLTTVDEVMSITLEE